MLFVVCLGEVRPVGAFGGVVSGKVDVVNVEELAEVFPAASNDCTL
jgi:hypothetical protein